jgi:hydroxymethylpyrimidine/phosphomethylpyrimidine kinase
VSLAGCRFPLVVDPVGISKHGAALIGPAALAALKRRLLPLATLVTPNLPEAAALADFPVETEADMERAARAIADLGPAAVLVKGGHLQGEIVDLLYADGLFHRRRGPRLATRQTHGTGCVLSAAIAARLARGRSLPESVAEAQEFVQLALRSAPGLGEGFGPLDLHASPPA